MKMKAIKKSIAINATPERIWDVITKDQYTHQWYAEFSEGTQAHTDWKLGSKAIFTDRSKNGMIAKVKENTPGELLSLEYTGLYSEGKEDYDSPEAKRFKGGHETYRLEKDHEAMLLKISSDVDEKQHDSMAEFWDKALEKIRELAEGTA